MTAETRGQAALVPPKSPVHWPYTVVVVYRRNN